MQQGVPTLLLIDVPGVAQIHNNTASLSYFLTNFDDPRDTENILNGIVSYQGSFGNCIMRFTGDVIYQQSGMQNLFRTATAGYFIGKSIFGAIK